MDDQRILLDYETIKGAVAGEKWAMERILKHYDFYMDELATVKEREPDGNVKCYVDEVLKQAIDYSSAMKSRFRKSGNQITGRRKSSLASLLA